MGKSLKRNYFYNILLNISKVIFPLITAPYISRVLEPDGVGLFNFANTYSNYFALVAALGIPLYGVREVAKIKDDIQSLTKFVSEIISLSCATTFVTTLIYVCSVFFIPQLSKDYIIFLLIALGLYTTPFAIDWYFRGREEFGYITLRALIVRTASVNDWKVLCLADGDICMSREYEGLEVLDRVGIGDSFAAGFVYGLMTSEDPELAVNYGAAHGALAMTTPGDTSMARLSEVEAIMNAAGARVKR